MLQKIIAFSVKQKLLVALGVLGLVSIGLRSMDDVGRSRKGRMIQNGVF